MRNKIAHDYTGIDFEMVFEVVKIEIPDLKIGLEKIVSEKIKEKVFHVEEFLLAKENPFYRHITFDKIKI